MGLKTLAENFLEKKWWAFEEESIENEETD